MSIGEIIGIINADDWYEKDTVKCIINEYKHNGDIDVFHGNEYRRTTYGKYLCINKPRTNYNDLWKGMILYYPTCFITKKAYEKWGLFDNNYKITGDYEFLLRLYIKNAKFKYLSKKLVSRRDGGISIKQAKLGFIECKNIQIKYGLNPIKANTRKILIRYNFEWLIKLRKNIEQQTSQF